MRRRGTNRRLVPPGNTSTHHWLHAVKQMSLVMSKPAFCICENKGADQLCGNRTTDQRLCFCYTDSTTPLLFKIRNSKPLAIFCGCTARFVWDLVGNPEDRFSHNETQIGEEHSLYANTPLQYTATLYGYKKGNFQIKKCDIF